MELALAGVLPSRPIAVCEVNLLPAEVGFTASLLRQLPQNSSYVGLHFGGGSFATRAERTAGVANATRTAAILEATRWEPVEKAHTL